jgi:hypothetical protein
MPITAKAVTTSLHVVSTCVSWHRADASRSLSQSPWRTFDASSPASYRPPAMRHVANHVPQPRGSPCPIPETATSMGDAVSRGT